MSDTNIDFKIIAKASTELSADPKFAPLLNDKSVQDFLSKLKSNGKDQIIGRQTPQIVDPLLSLSVAISRSGKHREATEEVSKLICNLLKMNASAALSLTSICASYQSLVDSSPDKVVRDKCRDYKILVDEANKNSKTPEEIEKTLQQHKEEPPSQPSANNNEISKTPSNQPQTANQASKPTPNQSPRTSAQNTGPASPTAGYISSSRSQNSQLKSADVKERAEAGDAEAMFDYSQKLKKGEGYPRNRKESIKYLKLSADHGYAPAQYEYGYICFHGESGVREDYIEATKYFKMAADQQDPNGEYRYGYALYSGKGCSKDYQKAAQFMQSAADKGICGAQYFYGYFLMRGLGIAKNLEEARKYLQLAANQGDKRAKDALKQLR
ncbi:hypothetical protein TRFO_04557 [Tritrichomonas foetus]|uniref:Sel1 repeat family protein n=1 Tax=Tritrichomonas foetus TaxID=1144522 RepID=A0A1J4KE57_9EUKA|nr:hypothetical protein TRFO_04557 [Tritrichomonas foetus]|eukprot:OHT09475.1 hypothetical protein TRFO_04557 [Tritrichomonas foetus]